MIELHEGLNTVNISLIPKALRPPCGDAGDVDGDGWVTYNDAQMIAEYVVGNITLTPEQLLRADVNGDGVVNIVDAMLIAQYVEGIRDTFPVCTMLQAVRSQVGAGSDDAAEYAGNGAMFVTDPGVAVATEPADFACQWGAHRWVVSIPKGKTIKIAYASLYVHNANVDDVYVNLHFELAASPTTFTTNPGNITSRARTVASASWIASSLGVGWHDTPSLVAPLQELVNAYSINSIVLIFKPIPNLGPWAFFFTTAYDGDPTLAAKLYVDYI